MARRRAPGRRRPGGPLRAASDALPREVAPPPGAFLPIDDEIRELERTRMAQALAAAHGNQTAAAELIKMSLRTFQAKARVYGLRHKDRR